MQGTKKFHEEYFESKKNRDKLLANARRDVDKSHKEVKGSDKPKAVRGVNAPNPMQDIINKEAGESSRHKNTVRIISFCASLVIAVVSSYWCQQKFDTHNVFTFNNKIQYWVYGMF